ncbi:MAG: VacJ family lipoprotein [Alphaproteobacteria bacterium]|nr:VacJ family lipoprotein [Alphaproteobacteria bacterium]
MRRFFATTFLAAALLSGCAAPGELDEGEVYDPIEPANRMVFAVNETIDTFVLQPTAFVYKETIPAPVRDMVRSFLDWVRSPVILVNDILQSDWAAAEITASRFVANAPMFGFVDNATGLGLVHRDEDFGQTLGVWGTEGGIYIMLPLLGPSNTRDTVGRVVDYFMDPTTYIGDDDANFNYQISRRAVDGIDFRARNYEVINDLKATSVDYYARVRTIYQQARNSAIRNGAPAPSVPSVVPNSSGEFDEFVPSSSDEQTGSKPAASD